VKLLRIAGVRQRAAFSLSLLDRVQGNIEVLLADPVDLGELEHDEVGAHAGVKWESIYLACPDDGAGFWLSRSCSWYSQLKISQASGRRSQGIIIGRRRGRRARGVRCAPG
jgi:hypothetical protein